MSYRLKKKPGSRQNPGIFSAKDIPSNLKSYLSLIRLKLSYLHEIEDSANLSDAIWEWPHKL